MTFENMVYFSISKKKVLGTAKGIPMYSCRIEKGFNNLRIRHPNDLCDGPETEDGVACRYINICRIEHDRLDEENKDTLHLFKKWHFWL